MELVTLTTEIRKYFGITSCHITKDDKDFMAMLAALSDESLTVSCSYADFEKGQVILVVFPTLFGKCEIECEIKDIKEEVFITIEGKINSTNKNDFFVEFQNYMNNIMLQKKRKEERILCNKKTLELLNLNNLIFITYKMRKYKAVIKDISYSGLRVLVNPVFLDVKDDMFNFTVFFNNPEEKFFFIKCYIVRKMCFEFEGKAAAEIVFKLSENVKYRQRLDSYFNKRNKSRVR